MPIELLKKLLEEGKFHHATYREMGSIWEGLYIYENASKEEGGFRGYKLVGCFNKNNPDLKTAEELVRDTGVSLGSFGKG